jgi:hypothetical protein
VVRIDIPDRDGCGDLIRALVGAIGAEAVFLDPGTREVCIDESRGTVELGRVLSTISLWLAECGHDHVTVRDGLRTYTVKRPPRKSRRRTLSPSPQVADRRHRPVLVEEVANELT